MIRDFARLLTLPRVALALVIAAAILFLYSEWPNAYDTVDLSGEEINDPQAVLNHAYKLREEYTRVLTYTDFANAAVKVLELAGLGLGALVLLLVGIGSRPRDEKEDETSTIPLTRSLLSKISPGWVFLGLATIVIAHVLSQAYGSERRREILGRASFVIGCAISQTTFAGVVDAETTGDETTAVEPDDGQTIDVGTEGVQTQDGETATPGIADAEAEADTVRVPLTDKEQAHQLWVALNAVQGSVIAELSGTQLGGSRQSGDPSAGQRIKACTTRLLTP